MGGGKEGFYHTVVIQKLDQSILIVFLFMPTLSCDHLINNETISSSWNTEAPYLISWQLTIHIYCSMSILP